MNESTTGGATQPPLQPQPCPSCGACPTCGRPQPPPVPDYLWWPQPWTIASYPTTTYI